MMKSLNRNTFTCFFLKFFGNVGLILQYFGYLKMQQTIFFTSKKNINILGKKLALMLFFEDINGAIFTCFWSSAIVHQPNQPVNSKGHPVNNFFSFVIPGIGVLSLPETSIFFKIVKLFIIMTWRTIGFPSKEIYWQNWFRE